METKHDIFNLPDRLFKYYGYDSKLNAKRLSGEIYLACPFDFNDPCDCQREWLVLKMEELGFEEEECIKLSHALIADDSEAKERVHKRMLQQLGILCLTSTQADTLMWGYYAKNEGICIEYDTSKIIKHLVIGYINKMSYTTTRFLYEKRFYYQIPEQRTPKLKKTIITKANDLIKKIDIKKINNRFLREQKNELNTLNFMRNIFLKRIYAQSIIYNVDPNGSPSTLFFDRGNKVSETKYFKKTKTWKHEKEFRFVVSLGGRMAISIGKECIKNIYLGCNMSNEKIVAIAYLGTVTK